MSLEGKDADYFRTKIEDNREGLYCLLKENLIKRLVSGLERSTSKTVRDSFSPSSLGYRDIDLPRYKKAVKEVQEEFKKVGIEMKYEIHIRNQITTTVELNV
ncbi:MAG: hypothetical protein CL489_10775 [Acidobacteria bacterium]|nr:hypothetical protein [Acidobacteriota bacterium]|tara:strand:- start:2692 stop:2997 length:306 start_codon:yes stop_codon:yes gene_type:complete